MAAWDMVPVACDPNSRGPARITRSAIAAFAVQHGAARDSISFVAEAIRPGIEHDSAVRRSGLDATARDALNIRERKS